MKKLFTSIMSLTMASLLTFGATGCTTSSNNGGDAVTEIIKQDRVSYYGTHEQSAVDTDKYLVKNGVCDYVVVLP